MSAKYFYIDMLEDLYQNIDDVPDEDQSFVKELYEHPAVVEDAHISVDDKERIERLHGDYID